jgi:cell division protein FtsQ
MPRVTAKTTGRKPLWRWRRHWGAIKRGAGFGALALVLVAMLWGWRSGSINAGVAALGEQLTTRLARAGLVVETVMVTGRRRTSPSALLAALDVSRGDPLLGVDLAAARARIERLGWVKSARLTRRLPDRIDIALAERVPFAVWQYRDRLRLIDAQGAVIAGVDPARFASLPLIVGKGAPAHAAALLEELESEPELARRVRAAVRIADRRWNLRFDNGVDVRLPENNPMDAWRKLARLERQYRILARDIVLLDLRLPDRLIVRLSPAEARRRRHPGSDA